MGQPAGAMGNWWNAWGGVLAACLLALAAVLGLSGRFTTVRFDEERIDVAVQAGLIHVHGVYHYQNTSRLPALLTLGVPFPVDARHAVPRAFRLEVADGPANGAEQDLDPLGPPARLSVRLFFRPRQGKWMTLDYWQPVRVAEGRYILTTTRAWRRPIGRAAFRLTLPAGCTLRYSNYPLARLPTGTAQAGYTFRRTNFYPAADWQFAWTRGEMARREGSAP